jgi:hypothetical protein
MEELEKYDAYNWIVGVIRSCDTLEQFETTENLVLNFNNLFQDEVLYNELMEMLDYYKIKE